MPEFVLLLAGVAIAAVVVLAPLRARGPDSAATPDDGRESQHIAHRAALEALRDVEADHRAGSLDPDAYAAELASAEAEAAATRAALDAPVAPPSPTRRAGRGPAMVLAAIIGLLLVGGSLISGTGLANAVIVNSQLAAAQAAEAARQAKISELLDAVAADPTDADALSDLADAFLAGPDSDMPRAAAALQLLINADPGRADAYERLMTAYLRVGDFTDARAVHDSYVALDAADPIEAAFFDGLIALRGEGDPGRALAAFDRFLELAPNDPRAPMIRGLRDEAAAVASPAPSG